MRKVVVGAFVSLDGVMQAPGGPEEDPTGGFEFGGWTPPFWDETLNAAMGENFSEPFDLLLGRRTYDIFAAHWPFVEMDPAASSFNELNMQIARQFNGITKYVATHHPDTLTWQNSQALGPDVAQAVRDLKKGDGPILLTQGSTELLQLLFEHDLVDELRLVVMPVVLGKGKRLFGTSSMPAAFKLAKSATSPSGAIVATYERAGPVQTGSFAMDEPTEAELERRRKLKSS
ncbi:MAG TPA: dihydrofolate reductase family protein [Rhizobiaceae bacterium]|nr:dihydrofolate reductase family protein [Rhizobiaceae bacterium]